MDDAVAAADTAGKLFLLDVHDFDDVGCGDGVRQGIGCWVLRLLFRFVVGLVGREKFLLLGRVDADFRKQMPTDEVGFAAAQAAFDTVGEHGGQPVGDVRVALPAFQIVFIQRLHVRHQMVEFGNVGNFGDVAAVKTGKNYAVRVGDAQPAFVFTLGVLQAGFF